MSGGVKVVGAPDAGETVLGDQEVVPEAPIDAPTNPAPTGQSDQSAGSPPSRAPKTKGADHRLRRTLAAVTVVALLGVAGTIGFGLAWSAQNARTQAESQVRQTSTKFLTDLTNFDAKTVDADFAAITNMATGTFAGQARRFFNSAIRQELETALASSRGQVRSLYVESISGSRASTYAVVDQLYANNKITAPQSDVLRIVLDLADTAGGWKVSDVTVLQGPTASQGSTPASAPAGSASTPAPAAG
ncbi:MAG: hypothetical protein ACYDHU_12065 [Acidimicrobiales bacterium]